MSIGLTGVTLAVYLSRIGLSSAGIGLVIGVGLAGAAAGTLVVTLRGDRVGRRRTLVALALLSGVGGLALALRPGLPALALLAFVGMLNGMGTDRSASFALEQAVIPGLVPNEQRTWTLAWYNVVLDACGSLGALAGALPAVLERWAGLSLPDAYRAIFIGYSVLGVATAALYATLSPAVEIHGPGVSRHRPSAATKSIVTKLTGVFAIDSLGGGFLTDALVAYWFFRRFGMTEAGLGLLFFVIRVLNALSHIGAAWLARRIGIINTMVFTHLPSSLLLVSVPFAPSLRVAVVLLLLREALVEMDVPTRQSYVAAMVEPAERTFASGVTNLARNAAWAVGSSLSGLFMQNIAFSAPLLFGGGLKIAYDVILYASFRRHRPPEESATRNLGG